MRKKLFYKKVCIIGAESTGTTTMAKALAEHYKTVWVPEFGRLYWESKMYIPDSSNWKTREFVRIAREQKRLEGIFAKMVNKILICDTDPFATTLWHDRYLGHMSDRVSALDAGDYDLYFLTGDEIPFIQDGTRDGERIRHKMHVKFIRELIRNHKNFVILKGSHVRRLKRAVRECDKILAI